ncbi:MAG: sensor histidine kinase [Gemmatimonadaceae bacterium]
MSQRLTQDEIIGRLASHRLVGGAPAKELAWLAEHGEFRRYAAGDLLLRRGEVIVELIIVFTGRFAIHVDQGAGVRKVMEWQGGDLSGQLPYSRMSATPGDAPVEEDTEALFVHRDFFPEMILECPTVTTFAVHVMLDRARTFNAAALQDEKMMSLGKLAAGLAHEINNPAAAAVRSAKHLADGLAQADAAARALGALALNDAQRATLDRVREICMATPSAASLSPIEQADREDAITDWLARHGAGEDVSAALAATPVTLETLDMLAGAVQGPALDSALQWIASGCSARSLATDIERAASRIHQLVSSVKRFTYMDRALVPEPVNVGQLLDDTVTVHRSKARMKSAALTLDVEPNLPNVIGRGGELNQVWSNLVDNALDAVAAGGEGRVAVTARREREHVVVRVADNGPGIPDSVRARIFDPFFTTKPPGQGTGLGLDIVQRVVRGHRGEIDVVSRPGHTEFRVALPTGDSTAA